MPDKELCGRNKPQPLITSDPRLFLIFNTSMATIAGQGFRAHYQFQTGTVDYTCQMAMHVLFGLNMYDGK